MSDGRTHFTLASRPFNDASLDMGLPPYASRLDVRATRAAFAAGTLGTVGDDVAREDVKRYVEVSHPDGYDANVMTTAGQVRLRTWEERLRKVPRPGPHFRSATQDALDLEEAAKRRVNPTDHEPREWYDEAERLRQSRLRRWQANRG